MNPKKKLVKNIFYISLILFTFLIIGCFGSPTTPGYKIQDQIDPYYCIWNLWVTYNQYKVTGMIDQYKNILSSDDYIFYFDPLDIGKDNGHGYIIPDSWDYNQDWQATQNMFNGAYSISFTIANLGYNGDEKDKDSFYNTYQPNWKNNNTECDISGVQINLLLYVDQIHGYQAIGPCDFSFKLCDDSKWRMTVWRDKTSPQ
jgi:hypothetical protein